MIEIATELGTALILQQPSELPVMGDTTRMYLDVETTSFDAKVQAFFPYLGHRIAGIAVLRGDEPIARYVPVRHTDAKWNIPLDVVQSWLADAMAVPEWVNHNVKFDAHFCSFDAPYYRGSLIDTVVLAKIHDSDRYTHGLKVLSKEWLDLRLNEADEVTAFLKAIKSKNYGDVPADIMGKYACMDVFSNRMLIKWLDERRPPALEEFTKQEIAFTPVLFDMEREGMQTNSTQIKRESLKSLERVIDFYEKLETLTEDEYTDSSVHHYDILVNKLGLPVVAWTKEGGPSFGKDALALYTIHPAVLADDKIKEIVDTIIACRTESHFRNLFLNAFLEHSDENGVLHSSYNQLVRTGRTSCSKPNAQQFSKRAKALIVVRDGEGIVSADASQIEFRFIMHYANDTDAIARYAQDPTTDFHQYVADQVHIQRRAGKTLNFAMGYGAGRRRVISLLSGNPDVMEEVSAKVNALIEAGELDESKRASEYTSMCEDMAARFYSDYHARFSGIKDVSNYATRLCRARAQKNAEEIGWIANAFGGRRHLPLRFVHKAFNTVVQGGAMAYIKSKMIALAPRNNAWIRDAGIRMFACVHDELAWCGPADVMADRETHLRIKRELEAPPVVELKVPMVWDVGSSCTNWASLVAAESHDDENT